MKLGELGTFKEVEDILKSEKCANCRHCFGRHFEPDHNHPEASDIFACRYHARMIDNLEDVCVHFERA